MKAQPAQPSSASVARAAASSSLYPKRRTSPPALTLDGDDASTSQPPPAKRQCSVSPSRPALRRSTPTDDVAGASVAPVASTSSASRPSAPATGSSARSSVTAVSSLGPTSVASVLAPALGPVDRDLRSLLELEYRDDVRAYMAEMEVRRGRGSGGADDGSRGLCPPSSSSTCSPSCSGTCDPTSLTCASRAARPD